MQQVCDVGVFFVMLKKLLKGKHSERRNGTLAKQIADQLRSLSQAVGQADCRGDDGKEVKEEWQEESLLSQYARDRLLAYSEFVARLAMFVGEAFTPFHVTGPSKSHRA